MNYEFSDSRARITASSYPDDRPTALAPAPTSTTMSTTSLLASDDVVDAGARGTAAGPDAAEQRAKPRTMSNRRALAVITQWSTSSVVVIIRVARGALPHRRTSH